MKNLKNKEIIALDSLKNIKGGATGTIPTLIVCPMSPTSTEAINSTKTKTRRR